MAWSRSYSHVFPLLSPRRSARRLAAPSGAVGLAKDSRCQRIIPAPADPRVLNRNALAGPGRVQELEVERAFGEALFEDGEGFGGAGHGAGS
jgi:hypothetical protein